VKSGNATWKRPRSSPAMPATAVGDALFQQAFAALTKSPGARAYYDAMRARGINHNDALRRLANRLVGILHGCLRHRTPYDEATAWPPPKQDQQTAA
jgi:hypothetical protein